jgi:hypothetical protein
MSLHPNTQQNHKINTVNKSSENAWQFKYIIMTVTNKTALTNKYRKAENESV